MTLLSSRRRRASTAFFVTIVAATAAFAQVPPPPQEAPLPKLTYTCSWIGNSFGGGPNWVQNFCEGMYVAPDGTVYVASGWDESGREFGIYRDGKVVGKLENTHGWGTGGGKSIVATDKYIFVGHSQGNEGGGLKGVEYPPKGKTWFGISRYTLDGKPAPFPGGGGRFEAFLRLREEDDGKDAQIRQLSTSPDGTRLLIVTSDGVNTARDTETLQEIPLPDAALLVKKLPRLKGAVASTTLRMLNWPCAC